MVGVAIYFEESYVLISHEQVGPSVIYLGKFRFYGKKKQRLHWIVIFGKPEKHSLW